ncbi:MAG: altronate dehydratase, partial [Clostridiales bacterium]|nr:altronate dehydratase [Clostridiales bacterium]
MKTIQIHPKDNVLVALSPIEQGETVQGVEAVETVPQGHKMALRDIAQGENVIKYGFPIGHALTDIKAGSWVHTHNVKTNLSGELSYTYQPSEIPALPLADERTFRGYLRPDGRAAVRNEIWIIPTVGCVNSVAEKLVKDQDFIA